MEPTREIFWNVSQFSQLLMYSFVALAVFVIYLGFAEKKKIYKRTKPLNRFDQKKKRFQRMFKQALLQTKVKRTGPGKVHAAFLAGFAILVWATALVGLQHDLTEPLLGITFLKGNFYLFFSLVSDLGGFLALMMLLGFTVRRFFMTPKGLPVTGGDRMIHLVLLFVLISGFVLESFRMAATETFVAPGFAVFSPIGYLLSLTLKGWPPQTLAALHMFAWWLHFGVVLSFL